ncbi:unnamed protein product [Rhodiola kirilowii]
MPISAIHVVSLLEARRRSKGLPMQRRESNTKLKRPKSRKPCL